MNSYIVKARYGINYVIDAEPFNQQASVRMLEYAALNLPIVTTRYAWIEQFQQQYGGNFFYLAPDLSNFTWEAVFNFGYVTPNLQQWGWEQQIRRSGVLEFLESKFEVKF